VILFYKRLKAILFLALEKFKRDKYADIHESINNLKSRLVRLNSNVNAQTEKKEVVPAGSEQ
jgi:hypothetical protein